jgi:hypothetical protein
MRPAPEARRLLLGFAALLCAATLAANVWLSATTSAASASGIVISQIYGGGGNSGATLKNDFIELFNAGNAPVDVSGWSVQYASAAGSSWQVTNLCPSGHTCIIDPGRYYLIQEAQGAGGTMNLPPPDATGLITMSATSAKVAVVNNNVALSGTCPLGGSVIDFVGYGSAGCFEGSGRAGSPSNTNALLRLNNGCTDSDNNVGDFATGLPNPRNSSAPATTCGISPSPSPSPTPTPDCGVERWSVKTGTDPDAPGISFVSQPTTIGTMRSWTPPSPIPMNSRFAPYETTVWTVNATLFEYKFEDDSDYHLVLRDESGNTIIAEIPNPGCVGSGSPFAALIANARIKFNAMFTASTSFKVANVPVQITGPAMFDFLHGQTGVAPNGIEIHPVLDINFTAPQLLLEESPPASNEAVAITPLLMRDPFDVINPIPWLNPGSDQNTRVMVFATNVQLQAGEPPSTVVVNLVDSANHSFDVPAEDVRQVPDFEFAQIMFRLPDGLASGTCTVKVKLRGLTTNAGTIRIR